MAQRVIVAIILVPFFIIFVTFAVINRAPVPLVLDPFDSRNLALTYTLPFFVWLFSVLILGLILGALIMWFQQGKYRKMARVRKAEIDKLRSQVGSTEQN